MPKVRLTLSPSVIGTAFRFNMSAAAPEEVIVGFDDGDMDSVYVRDLDVFVEATGEWKPLSAAFKDRDVICDNYNTEFFEPRTAKDRARGYTL